ncbi:MAG: apiosidase-like domain-containing protein [Leifsonia sp.]
MPSAAPWKPLELEFSSLRHYADPYSDVDVTVTFSAASGAILSRPAFWDGGVTWRVRFAPTEPGRWTYSTTATVRADTGLHGVAGAVDCFADDDGDVAASPGFLEAAPSGRHLRYRDGTPFFWLADTHWRFAWERWDEANKPGWSSQFRDTVDLRVRQGFTVYQGNLLSYSPPDFWSAAAGGPTIDVAFFRDVVDPRMAYIAEAGLVHALGIGWHHAADEDPAALTRLARYVVARYGAYPVVWTLGGEVAGYDAARRADRIAAWRDVALAIRDIDDYHHPISAHLTNERPIAGYYQDEDWLTLTLNQLGHGDLDMDPSHWTEHLRRSPGRPLVEGESFYEGLISVEATGRRQVTDVMMRQVAYRAIQSGCCGYSYGAQGCWNAAWDQSEAESSWGSLPWYEGVDLPGGQQLGYLRQLYESLPWTALRPADHAFTADSGINETFYPPSVAADDSTSTVVIHFGETYRPDEGGGLLQNLPQAAYRLEWFDPRTGERSTVAAEAAPVDGRLPVPPPPSPEDWVLVASAIESEKK